MALNIPGVPFKLTPQDMGGFDLGAALRSGLQTNEAMQKARVLPKDLAESLLSKQLQNKINQPKADYANEITQADLANTQANTGLLQQNSYKQQLLNQFLPQREPAEIEEIKARGNYYNTGGAGGSTGSKDAMAYSNGVAMDNPQLNPMQLREAADVLSKGGNRLNDGTMLNPMSFNTKTSFDRAVKATTTAGQINALNSANQADAELGIFTNLANKWRAPYGTTYFGKSPEQIVDSFRSDNKSQTRLGELIAANTLEYEIAQIRNRIAAGQPGITAVRELMDESKQHIETSWPKLSGKARSVTNQRLNQAIQEGLQARNKSGAGAGSLYSRQFSDNQPYETKPGGPIGGAVGMYKNGVLHFIPTNDAKEAESMGYTYER